MTKSWVSGGKSADLIEKLRREISELEARRDELVERNKHAVFEWGSFLLNSKSALGDSDQLRNHPVTQDVKGIIADYDALNQLIMEKQVLLNEKLDEQAKLDSLG